MKLMTLPPAVQHHVQLSQSKISARGVSAVGSSTHFLVQGILKRDGLDPTRDVAILGVGTTASHYQALQTGAIDATNLTPPFNFRAQEAGLRELVAFVKEDYLVEPAGAIGAELGAKKWQAAP